LIGSLRRIACDVAAKAFGLIDKSLDITFLVTNSRRKSSGRNFWKNTT
jgi:hypothetical protein